MAAISMLSLWRKRLSRRPAIIGDSPIWEANGIEKCAYLPIPAQASNFGGYKDMLLLTSMASRSAGRVAFGAIGVSSNMA